MRYYHSHTFELNQRKNERIEYATNEFGLEGNIHKLLEALKG